MGPQNSAPASICGGRLAGILRLSAGLVFEELEQGRQLHAVQIDWPVRPSQCKAPSKQLKSSGGPVSIAVSPSNALIAEHSAIFTAHGKIHARVTADRRGWSRQQGEVGVSEAEKREP